MSYQAGTRSVRKDPLHIPSSTYRLQLNRQFTFNDALDLVDYLDALGIGDCYLSPFFMAAPGSTHGYDITNPNRINPEIGTREEFQRLSECLKQRGMGVVADVVPNHMCISEAANEWWWDVLENGPSSPFARYFDINWNPPKKDLINKVLLPILGDQYGRVLEDRQISIVYDRGAFFATVYENPLPLAPRSWGTVLAPAAAALKRRLGETHEHVLELESILTALSHMAPAGETDPDKIRERQREKEITRKRLAALADSNNDVREEIEASLRRVNGVKGDPHSFDRLEEILAQQSHRLSFWKVAADEINYRRFFDINRLAAIRVEDPEVFQAVHALLLELIGAGQIDGLRIDHSDGLYDPAEYFDRLQAACMAAAHTSRPFYIVTEKILLGNEELRSGWAIEGTTGYDFLGLVNGMFVDRQGRRAFLRLYEAFTNSPPFSDDLVYESKRLILQTSMSGELNVLAGKLDKISEQHRWSRDFTLASLRHVLRETIASFPIYRTYTTYRLERPDAEDERYIRQAIALAKRRNQSTDESIFDFLQGIQLLQDPEGIDEAQRVERRAFAMSLQQFTGPVMAKGLEDTALYRRFPLASLNEVGSDPRCFGSTAAAFHIHNLKRRKSWPNALLATSTHDSKRSEDVRARIDVLSEIPADWHRAIRSWRTLNAGRKAKVAGSKVPSPAEEYLFYQTLAGVWPLKHPQPCELKDLTNRLHEYMRKALREAKVHSSWINPNQAYEEAVDQFIAAALEPSPASAFLREVMALVDTIKAAGMWNSLSQTLLKIASPGVPDFYQGSELWDFSLVDPDNRRSVDYRLRRELMRKVKNTEGPGETALIQSLLTNPADGAIKLYLTRRALNCRKADARFFAEASYVPLRAKGALQKHVVAFARNLGNRSVLAIAGRFFLGLGGDRSNPTGEATWGDSAIILPRSIAASGYCDAFTRSGLHTVSRDGKRLLPLSQVFGLLPVALLESIES